MTQTIAATAVLGPGKTGLTIGLRVLNLDGTTYSAFSTTGVAETAIAGTYRKAGGVPAPDAGGYVVFGTVGTDLAETTIDPVMDVATAVADLPTATDFDDLVASLSTVAVTVVSPVDPDTHDISVNVSSDYYADHGWSLDFTSTSWPTLTGATVWMRVNGYATTLSGSVVDADTVRFELDRTTLAAIGLGSRRYEVLATLAAPDGHQILLVAGTFSITGLV